MSHFAPSLRIFRGWYELPPPLAAGPLRLNDGAPAACFTCGSVMTSTLVPCPSCSTTHTVLAVPTFVFELSSEVQATHRRLVQILPIQSAYASSQEIVFTLAVLQSMWLEVVVRELVMSPDTQVLAPLFCGSHMLVWVDRLCRTSPVWRLSDPVLPVLQYVRRVDQGVADLHLRNASPLVPFVVVAPYC